MTLGSAIAVWSGTPSTRAIGLACRHERASAGSRGASTKCEQRELLHIVDARPQMRESQSPSSPANSGVIPFGRAALSALILRTPQRCVAARTSINLGPRAPLPPSLITEKSPASQQR